MTSVRFPEYFKLFSTSVTPLWGSLAPNVLPRNGPNRRFSKGSCFRVFRRSAKRKNRSGSARLDAVCVFSHLLRIFLQFQYGKCTNMDFSQNIQMQRYVFFILIRFLAVSWIQGCFHWLSSSIRSEVMGYDWSKVYRPLWWPARAWSHVLNAAKKKEDPIILVGLVEIIVQHVRSCWLSHEIC